MLLIPDFIIFSEATALLSPGGHKNATALLVPPGSGVSPGSSEFDGGTVRNAHLVITADPIDGTFSRALLAGLGFNQAKINGLCERVNSLQEVGTLYPKFRVSLFPIHDPKHQRNLDRTVKDILFSHFRDVFKAVGMWPLIQRREELRFYLLDGFWPAILILEELRSFVATPEEAGGPSLDILMRLGQIVVCYPEQM